MGPWDPLNGTRDDFFGGGIHIFISVSKDFSKTTGPTIGQSVSL